MAAKRPTAEEVLKFTKPTEGFLCALEDNNAQIQFLSFKIRDVEKNKSIFDTETDSPVMPTEEEMANDPNVLRKIKYRFHKSVYTSKQIGTTLVFSVGDQPVKNFRMIERHYFKNKLLRSFDFNFPFCIPNSTNNWECIYEVPKIAEKDLKDMIASPFQLQSDSFYFVDNVLIMHNKAFYSLYDK